jgi:ATP-dependent DNA ligase
LGRSRAVRSLLGRLERRSLKANVLRNGCIRPGRARLRLENKPKHRRNETRLGLEGIVSKKLNAPYRSGPSKTWIKVKNPKAPAATRAVDGTF